MKKNCDSCDFLILYNKSRYCAFSVRSCDALNKDKESFEAPKAKSKEDLDRILMSVYKTLKNSENQQ